MYTFILSIVLFLIGNLIKHKINFFTKFCIPAPVISGLLFSILVLLLKVFKICTITMDTKLMPYFICGFFTIVGLGVSFNIFKKGGKLLIKYWLLCGILAYCQNLLALFLSKLLNFNPLLGLMCGTISMEGGHGSAAAFGATIENLGVSDAISVGITAATFGLILSGLLGGPLAKFLIVKYNLISNNTVKHSNHNSISTLTSYSFTTSSFLEQILIVLLCIALGEFIANIFSLSTNIIIPAISGCMLISIIFRNVNDKVKIFKFNFKILDFLGDACLGIFLTMALMSIDLYKLSSLFGPILIIVLSQAVFITLFSIFICFRVLGKNLDSAIMISGLIGHGLGATPTALANMNSVGEIYGYSEKSVLVVTIVAAFLLDIFTMPCIIFFINILS
ncbi:sodium/glutamate symporter [Romboutsia sp.]|uniref:sodium/glutamate symporter n=1 Tax=Romboutsia sp. TaxID=1965302 RepID=UPI003F3155A5